MFYPIFLNLQQRPVLVVGGGLIAERKVETLLEAGAAVTVVSPEITDRLRDLANSGRIILHRRTFASSDLDGISLVISSTDDAGTQREVAALATAKNIWCNTVDKPDLCDFIVPSILRRGDVTLAISTGGKSPTLAAALRARLEPVLTENVARTAAVLGLVRQEVHSRFAESDQRKQVFEKIINSGIIDWIGGCDDATALERVRQMIAAIS